MKWYWIVLIILSGAGIVYLGIRNKNLIMTILGFLVMSLGSSIHLFKKNNEMKDELKRKEAEIVKQREATKVFEKATKEVGKAKDDSYKNTQVYEKKIEEARKSDEPIKKSISIGNDIVDSFNNDKL